MKIKEISGFPDEPDNDEEDYLEKAAAYTRYSCDLQDKRSIVDQVSNVQAISWSSDRYRDKLSSSLFAFSHNEEGRP